MKDKTRGVSLNLLDLFADNSGHMKGVNKNFVAPTIHNECKIVLLNNKCIGQWIELKLKNIK